jgi:hypothetical protein
VAGNKALEAKFPALRSSQYSVTSPKDPTYNCIAWAAGDDTMWWEPVSSPTPGGLGGYYWPDGLPRKVSFPNYILAFKRQGYRECPDGSLEDGWEKVALYVDSQGTPTHAARQLPDGHWASKLGRSQDIEHDVPEAVGGPSAYGTVQAFLRRTRKADRPHPSARNIRT